KAKQPMNPGAIKSNKIRSRATDGLFTQPAADAVAPVEPEDLSRFEGEDGLEATMPATELEDAPLGSAIWRKLRRAAQQTNGKKMTT
ncbi:MAG TPA: hypothetical protein VKA67_04765, partial [Verrucomicrobiae bacterium]|nr:hypothetical protein [Verrucomicrobiae bacterium]